MSNRSLILVGGGGHCRSCIEVVESSGEFIIAGILDAELPAGTRLGNYEILGTDDEIPSLCRVNHKFLVSLGSIHSLVLRRKIFDRIKTAGGKLATVIASTAHVSKNCQLGEGTIVMHRGFINAGASIGDNVIVNSGAIIEHDAMVASHSHIAVGAILNGHARVDESVFVGSGSVVINNVSVSRNCVIGAGSIVHRSIFQEGTYVGNPIRKIR